MLRAILEARVHCRSVLSDSQPDQPSLAPHAAGPQRGKHQAHETHPHHGAEQHGHESRDTAQGAGDEGWAPAAEVTLELRLSQLTVDAVEGPHQHKAVEWVGRGGAREPGRKRGRVPEARQQEEGDGCHRRA